MNKWKVNITQHAAENEPETDSNLKSGERCRGNAEEQPLTIPTTDKLGRAGNRPLHFPVRIKRSEP